MFLSPPQVAEYAAPG